MFFRFTSIFISLVNSWRLTCSILTGGSRYIHVNLCLFLIHLCSQVLQTFEVTGQGQVLKDISYGKEDIPVSCVNSVDNSFPEYLEYSTRRLPQAGVNVPFNVMLFARSTNR